MALSTCSQKVVGGSSFSAIEIGKIVLFKLLLWICKKKKYSFTKSINQTRFLNAFFWCYIIFIVENINNKNSINAVIGYNEFVKRKNIHSISIFIKNLY